MIEIKKKILPILMSILCAFSVFSGNVKAASYVLHVETPYGMNADKTYKWTIGLTQFTNAGVDDEVFAKLTLDGVGDVFCIDPLKNTIDGAGDYQATALSAFIPSAQVRVRLGYISSLGFGMDKSDEMRFATQIRIWQETFPNLVDNSTIHSDIQAKINIINSRLKIMDTDVSFKGQEVVLKGYGKDNAATLNDTTGTFSHYLPNKIAGIHTEKNGSSLKIWAEKGDSLNVSLVYDCQYLSTVATSPLAYYSPTSQGVGKFGAPDPNIVTLKVRMAVGDLTIAKQDEDGTYVPETSFALSYNSDMSDPIGTYKTGSSGKVNVSNLLAQTVYIQETSVPEHLVLDNAVKTVTIQDGQTSIFTARNNWIKGKVLLKKTDLDSGKQVANGTYAIFDSNDREIERLVTKESGFVESGYIRFGNYYVREIIAPTNYLINDKKYPITISSNEQKINISDSDKRVTGSITLTKEDSVLGNKPQGEATLKGAVYELKARRNILDPADASVKFTKDSVVATLTTDDNSKASVSNLYLGSYYLKEKTPSLGYQLDPTEYDVTLSYINQNTAVVTKAQTVKEKVIDGDFKITKVIEVDPNNSEIVKPEKNAEFIAVLKKYVNKYGSVEEAYKHKSEFANKEYDLLVTDQDGEVTSKKLAYGTYVLKQTKIGDENVSLLKGTFEVKISTENQPTIKYVVSNQKFLSYLQLIKKDADSGKVVTLSNTSFKVYDVDNNKYLTQRVGLIRHDTWTTDDTGKVTLPLKVPAGNYRLEEINAPKGYLISSKKIDFVMKETNVSIVDDENEPIQIVEFSNTKPVGKIEITKKDKDTDDILSGVQYQLTAAENIVDVADGSILYKKGSPVSVDISEEGYYMTNELGEIEIDNLPLGKYQLIETRALDGYVQDEKIYSVELKQKDNVQKLYTHKVDLTNQKTKTFIKKLDNENNVVEGAKLHLEDAEGNLVDKWISKKAAYKIEGLHVGKTYTLYEDKAPEGYVLSKPIKFTIENVEEKQTFSMIDKQVFAQKYDEDGKELEGATLQVLSAKTKNVIDEWTTDGSPHAINGLVENGKYILREKEAPNGYVVAKDVLFKVSHDKETQTFSMVDKQVFAQKYDEDGKELEGATLQVLSAKTKNVIDEWTTDGSPHAIYGLVENGKYILREKEAPEGLELAEDIPFIVDEDKEIHTLEMIDTYILTPIQINKVDSTTKEAIKSKDFLFSAYQDKECKVPLITENADTEKGTATFELRYGTWYLKEVAAPQGYQLSDEVVKVEINKEGVFINDKKVDPDKDIASIVYINTLLPTIKTGDSSNFNLYLLLSLLAGGSLILIQYEKRRKENM